MGLLDGKAGIITGSGRGIGGAAASLIAAEGAQVVVADFGVTLPDGIDVRVWDSTAEIRYLVIPQRPAGTDDWSEEQLADLVTRDSMIGVGLPLDPASIGDSGKAPA